MILSGYPGGTQVERKPRSVGQLCSIQVGPSCKTYRIQEEACKFKDAELIGIPIRVNVGREAEGNIVEVKLRADGSNANLSVPELLPFILDVFKKNAFTLK